MDAISYLITFVIYGIILILVTIPYCVLLILIIPFLEKIGIVSGGLVSWILGAPIIIWCFIFTPWLAHNATKRRLTNYESFWSSLGNAMSEGKIYLSFIPLVRKYFNTEPK
jgi:hypothetical protein